jgi:hypothetical protein
MRAPPLTVIGLGLAVTKLSTVRLMATQIILHHRSAPPGMQVTPVPASCQAHLFAGLFQEVLTCILQGTVTLHTASSSSHTRAPQRTVVWLRLIQDLKLIISTGLHLHVSLHLNHKQAFAFRSPRGDH